MDSNLENHRESVEVCSGGVSLVEFMVLVGYMYHVIRCDDMGGWMGREGVEQHEDVIATQPLSFLPTATLRGLESLPLQCSLAFHHHLYKLPNTYQIHHAHALKGAKGPLSRPVATNPSDKPLNTVAHSHDQCNSSSITRDLVVVKETNIP